MKQQGIVEFQRHENETPIRIHWQLLAFYGEDAVNISPVHRWMRQSWDSSRNLNLNDQPCFGRPVTTTHDLNRQKVDKLIQETC
jgi:hypothetical protein